MKKITSRKDLINLSVGDKIYRENIGETIEITKINSENGNIYGKRIDNWCIQCRETGDVIESLLNEYDAKLLLEKYEQEDVKDGTYTPDFYEIVDNSPQVDLFVKSDFIKDYLV